MGSGSVSGVSGTSGNRACSGGGDVAPGEFLEVSGAEFLVLLVHVVLQLVQLLH